MKRDQVIGYFARLTTCLIGRHRWQVWRYIDRGLEPGPVVPRGDDPPGEAITICLYCHRIAPRHAAE